MLVIIFVGEVFGAERDLNFTWPSSRVAPRSNVRELNSRSCECDSIWESMGRRRAGPGSSVKSRVEVPLRSQEGQEEEEATSRAPRARVLTFLGDPLVVGDGVRGPDSSCGSVTG